MEAIIIHNWEINENGISWRGSYGNQEYLISKNSLDMTIGDDECVYQTLVHVSSKSWMKEIDFYALNTAFIIALEIFGIGFSPKLSIARTLIEQQDIISSKK